MSISAHAARAAAVVSELLSLLNIFAVKRVFWCHVVFYGLMPVIIFSGFNAAQFVYIP
jgi:hypothetical protein